MLIVIEGVDGSGKSTLANELSTLLPDDATVLHRGPLRRHPLAEYFGDVRGYQPGFSNDIVADRWHLGEMVYGPLYRGASQLTDAMQDFIELWLVSRGAAMYVLAPDYEVLQQRLTARGEDFLQPQHLRLVADFYAEQPDPWTVITGKPSPDKIVARAKALESNARRLYAMTPEYLGPRDPHGVVLTSGTPRVLGLANVPTVGSPAYAMLSALRLAGGPRVPFGVCPVGSYTKQLHEALRRPKLVSLVPNAQNVPVVRIPGMTQYSQLPALGEQLWKEMTRK